MNLSESSVIGLTARVLTPFYYHGLYVSDGSATYAGVITDTALMFALAAAFSSRYRVLRTKGDTRYRQDIASLPWRASLLMGTHTQALAPVRHTTDITREGGYTERFRRSTGSGNYKTTFLVHEIAAGSEYEGIIVGIDPFKAIPFSSAKKLVIRVGAGRLGLLELTPNPTLKQVRLNVATARLFGSDEKQLSEDYRVLDTIRVSHSLSLDQAKSILLNWH
ncbi:hypothetical protein [Thioflexithrix psekupsensis]|uniref:Uncharacterized protein n=1 Tax=Thioflexithrix psekupsensis TaxID=1570016 RepID=A0A251X5Y7_9GAMM|nr:hypothetical protein [Thioflexithrix psekupsensis]OUD13073.1 hypothetical protein TPSD3_10505 [Thioflexithrix psekupsensis]